MEKVTAPKVEALKPLPVRPATAPAEAPSAPTSTATVAAPVSDEKQVAVGKVGLDSAARTTGLLKGVPEVDFKVVEAAPEPAAKAPEEAPFYMKAMGIFGNALSYTAKAVVNPLTLAADLSFMEKVKSWFSSDGNDTLKDLSQVGKLSAIDKNMTTLKGVIDKMLKAGVDPALIEILNKQAAQPTSIDQLEGKDTCQAAVFQMMLADNNPGAYVKAAAELFTQGSTTLPDGKKLGISEENLAWLKKQNLSKSELASAIFQVAIAEAVNAPDVYNVATDAVTQDGTGFFGWWTSQEKGGADFQQVVDFFKDQNVPLFDPRAQAQGTSAERAAALKGALDAARTSGGTGVSVPVRSAEGSDSKFHMVEVTGIDADGNVTVSDPQTGKATTFTQEEFLKLVGWDIKATDKVGGGRGSQSGGGGSGTV